MKASQTKPKEGKDSSMEKTKKWLDIESREIVTAKQLYDEYIDNMEDGTCGACTFDEYVINCLTINNGTLQEL
jgi:hypothetical protein